MKPQLRGCQDSYKAQIMDLCEIIKMIHFDANCDYCDDASVAIKFLKSFHL